LTLTGNEANYQVVSITGLNPPHAQVNTTSIAGLDGAKFNSAKLNTRNIVITLKLNGDVENNRHLLYMYFRTKEKCTFYYANNNLDVSIQGYVETVECNLFAMDEQMQISIVCPFPYFASIAEIITDISNETAAFHFPFAIDIGDPIPFSIYQSNRVTNVFNNSESETGVTIEVDIIDAVNSVKIINTNSGEYLLLNYAFQAGDRITINTNKGQKSVSLLRNGTTQNIFSSVQKGSTFFQLAVGDNEFSYQIDNGASDNFAFIIFRFHNLFRGV
jgi:phage-related protein